MKQLTLMIVFLLSFSLWGGEGGGFGKGNGGFGIFCSENKTWMMLDYFEAKELHQINIDSELLAREDFLTIVSERFERVNADEGNKFKEITKSWDKEIVWIESRDLGPMNDVFPTVLPVGCELKLAGFQRTQKYFLSRPIWDEMGSQQQRILMLHELVYRTFLASSALNDSRPVRALVALLLSEDFDHLSDAEIMNYMATNVSIFRY